MLPMGCVVLLLAGILCTMLFGPTACLGHLGAWDRLRGLDADRDGDRRARRGREAHSLRGATQEPRAASVAGVADRPVKSRREPIFTEPAGTVIKVALLGALTLWALRWFLR